MPANAPRLVPALVAAQAIPLLVAFWIGGRPGLGAAFAGTALVFAAVLAALFGLLIVSGLRGENGLVYAALLLFAEVVHITALAVLKRRS